MTENFNVSAERFGLPETQRFLAYAVERQTIYEKRQAGEPPPWTDDPVMRHYHFCNIYRRLDRVTQWIVEHYVKGNGSNPWLWLALVGARFFNEPASLTPFNGDIERWIVNLEMDMNMRHLRGDRMFRSAYMVRSLPGMPKHTYVIDGVIRPMYRECLMTDTWSPTQPYTLQKWWEFLMPFYGIGGFMAYEVVCDLTYSSGYLAGATDINTFTHMGPGAIRGLKRMLLEPPPKGDRHFPVAMAQVLRGIVNNQQFHTMPTWTLREVEHTLCEFDKYERVRLGQGHTRRYKGGT